MNQNEILVPGEAVLDRLPFRAFGRAGELILTDRRLVALGHTGALPVQLMLPRGRIAAGFPLARLDGFILGRGRRTSVLLLTVAFAVAGGAQALWQQSLYFALVAFCLAAVAFLAWTAWPVTFFLISAGALRFSGHARLVELQVFLERLELAADFCRRGLAPEEVREQVKLSGKLSADGTANEP